MAAERILKVIVAGDAKGLSKVFGDVGNDAEKLESKFGKFGSKAAVIGTATATAVGVAGVALFKLGSDFDGAYDGIRIATGKTGKELEGLEQSFRNVASKVPADFATVGTAIGGLSAKTGLSGKALEDLSTQVLNLSRITGTDLNKNIDTASKLMGDWRIPAGAMTQTLDGVFAVSQRTGVSFDTLVANLDKFGPTFRTLGVPMGEAVTLLGSMEKAGVPAEAVMTALGKASVLAADGHVSISKAMADSIQKIKDAKDPQEALTMATDLFGKKVSIEMVDAIRSGKLSLEDLTNATTGSAGAINTTAADTDDASQKMQLAFNNIKIALEPVATGMFEFAGTVAEKAAPAIAAFVGWIETSFVPAMQAAATWVNENVVPAVKEMGRIFAEDVLPAMKSAWENVLRPTLEALTSAATALYEFFRDDVAPALKTAWEVVSTAVTTAWDIVKPTIDAHIAIGKALADVFRDYVAPAMKVAWELIQTVASAVWKTVEAHIAAFKAAGEGLGAAWREVVGPAVEAAWKGVQSTASAVWKTVDGIIDAFEKAGSALATAWKGTIAPAISGAWEGIKNAFQFAWPAIQGVLGALGAAFGAVQTAVGHLVSAIEGLIDLIKSIPRAISIAVDWIIPDFKMPSIGGVIDKVNPFNAEGGYFAKATAGVFGEAGPEVILPLTRPDRMRELVSMPEVAGPLVAAMVGGRGTTSGRVADGGTTVVVNVYGNVIRERDLALTVRDGLLDLQRQGVSLGFN